MNITCDNCHAVIDKILTDIPFIWREQIVTAICDVLNLDNTLDPGDITACESITKLNNFVQYGDSITLTYTNESGTTTTSTININQILEGSLNAVDPKCLMDQESWNLLSHADKLNALINYKCECCPTTTTTTSTTTTTTIPINSVTIINNTLEALPFSVLIENQITSQDYVIDNSTIAGSTSYHNYISGPEVIRATVNHFPATNIYLDLIVDGSVFYSGVDTTAIVVSSIPAYSDIVVLLNQGLITSTTTTTSTSSTTTTTTAAPVTTTTTTKAPPTTTSTTTTTTICLELIGADINNLSDNSTTTTTTAPPTTTTTTSTTTTTTAVPTTTTTTTTEPTTSTTTTTTEEPTFIWAQGTTTCEKDGTFDEVKTITGLSSPYFVWYDDVNELVYVADGDEASGNVYWFDPVTATTEADMTHSTAVMHQYMYSNVIDPVYRRIYFVGRDSGGLVVYDIDTDTASVVPYGTNGIAYNRLSVNLTSDTLYCTDNVNETIVLVDRASLALISTVPISSIPSNTRFSLGGYSITEVGNELWVCAGTGSTVSTIGVYNKTLTTNIVNISLPSAATWVGAKYWQNMFHDDVSNNVYVADFGSSRRYVINPTTKTVLNNRAAGNREGKTSVHHYWSKHPITGELICSIQEMNNTSDVSIIKRVYFEDRTTYLYTKMFDDSYYFGLIPLTGTTQMAAAFPGAPYWTVPVGGQTDGSIQILDSATASSNTGWELTLTLVEINEDTEVPTGNTKPNVPEDPDYIAPTFNLTNCPVTADTACPADLITTFTDTTDTLEYEFSISSTVKENPSIAKIRVSAYNNITASVEGTPTVFNSPFTSQYFSGTFTTLTGTSYTIQIEYLDSGDVVLQTC